MSCLLLLLMCSNTELTIPKLDNPIHNQMKPLPLLLKEKAREEFKLLKEKQNYTIVFC